MPTVLRAGPYRFFFYSGDGDEPPHVHIEREDDIAKFWLNPVRLQQSSGFRRQEVNTLYRLVQESREELLRSWYEYFGN
ncbi:MAG: DUF4160 domain-containing protein [Anaerolineae bacterium]|nr:DUF4160 domain-containing protein [Anaerolineae bacterium]